jgi:hypothetical protein
MPKFQKRSDYTAEAPLAEATNPREGLQTQQSEVLSDEEIAAREREKAEILASLPTNIRRPQPTVDPVLDIAADEAGISEWMDEPAPTPRKFGETIDEKSSKFNQAWRAVIDTVPAGAELRRLLLSVVESHQAEQRVPAEPATDPVERIRQVADRIEKLNHRYIPTITKLQLWATDLRQKMAHPLVQATLGSNISTLADIDSGFSTINAMPRKLSIPPEPEFDPNDVASLEKRAAWLKAIAEQARTVSQFPRQYGNVIQGLLASLDRFETRRKEVAEKGSRSTQDAFRTTVPERRDLVIPPPPLPKQAPKRDAWGALWD